MLKWQEDLENELDNVERGLGYVKVDVGLPQVGK